MDEDNKKAEQLSYHPLDIRPEVKGLVATITEKEMPYNANMLWIIRVKTKQSASWS